MVCLRPRFYLACVTASTLTLSGNPTDQVIYGYDAGRLLEVGPSAPFAFAEYLSWIPRRTLVAPYFTTYSHSHTVVPVATSTATSTATATVAGRVAGDRSVGSDSGRDDHDKGGGGGRRQEAASAASRPMKIYKVDFLSWKAPHRYDLVVCSQVLEHLSVEDGAARKFLQKLLRIGRTVIISVPYRWQDQDCKECHHKAITHSNFASLTVNAFLFNETWRNVNKKGY